jgi:RsiW-degrading membrane proteinase PrsW (M82 family)
MKINTLYEKQLNCLSCVNVICQSGTNIILNNSLIVYTVLNVICQVGRMFFLIIWAITHAFSFLTLFKLKLCYWSDILRRCDYHDDETSTLRGLLYY